MTLYVAKHRFFFLNGVYNSNLVIGTICKLILLGERLEFLEELD